MNTRSLLTSRLPALFVLTLAACGSPAPDAGVEASSSSSPASLADVEALGVRNAANPLPGLITAGQVSEEQLDALAEMGYENFVSLRPTSEEGAGWEEAHVSGSGVSFTRIPVSGADGLTRQNVETLAELLEQASDEGTVLYCGSSNRVGALLALKAYWLDGADPEDALELGRAAGMTRLEGPVSELLSQPR